MTSNVLVVDCGSYSTKIGLAGSTLPQYIDRSIYTISAQTKIQLNGNTAIQNLSLWNKSKSKGKIKPLLHNIKIPQIKSDDNYLYSPLPSPKATEEASNKSSSNFEKYIESLIFDPERNLITNDPPSLLLTDELFPSNYSHSYQSEIYFETFGIQGLYFELSPILGMYGNGCINGLCIDIGHQQTSIVPIANGYHIEYASKKLNYIHGNCINVYFHHLLRKSGITLHTVSELETVCKIKEELCELLAKRYCLTVEEKEPLERYNLPDEKPLQIGSARFRAPEVLFRPNLIGIQENGLAQSVLDSLNMCHLQQRSKLMANIIVMGGSSKMKGLPQRLINEMCGLDKNTYDYNVVKCKGKRSRFKIRAGKSREYMSWIGGSIFASMDEFSELMVTKEMYDEYGANVFCRR